ncbi:hypothetical protein Tco_0497573 [Tanacetum coccineum]
MEQPQSSVAQQITPTNQLVHSSKFQTVGRCNNKVVLPNIPCLKECRIVGQLLVDHAQSYALTTTVDVPTVYIQQFWKTVRQVLNANETIRFMVNKEEITYTVDMFHATLKLPVETPKQPFIPLANFDYIKPFLKILGYQGSSDKKKNVIQYPRFTKLIIADIMEKYESIPKRREEDYYTIKNDTQLAYKDCETKYGGVEVLKIQPEPVESTQETHRTPRATRIPNPTNQKPTSTTPLPLSDDREHDEIIEVTQLSLALDKTVKVYEEHQNMAIVEKKMLDENVEKLVDGEEQSDGTDFADTVLLIDEDSSDRLELGSHKENSEKNHDDDDDDVKKDDKKDDDDDNDDDDHDVHLLIRTQVTGSLEIRTEKMHTPIPSPSRSPRIDLSSDMAIAQELTVSVSPTPTTSSQDRTKPISRRYTHILGVVRRMCMRRVVNAVKKERESSQDVVPALISQEFVTHAPKIIEELFRIYMQNTVLNVHPTTSTSTATTSDLQQQLYLKMKSDLQAQVADPELWDVLKAKFEKSSGSAGSCRDDAFRKRYHDKHQGDDAPPEGEKSTKRKKTSKSLKFARGSSSKQIVKDLHQICRNCRGG